MTRFDRFAAWCARGVAQAPFFGFCLLLVVGWLVQGILTVILTRDPSKFAASGYQLEINTTTTIITFLMVALLQNSQQQDVNAVHHKLDRLAEALADVDGVDRDKLADLIGSENRIGA